MGLLTALVTLPVAPVRGVIAVADQILKQAEREFYDPAEIHRQLELIDRLRATGELSEPDAVAAEDRLVERLLEGQERRRSDGDPW